ncbi:MAG TPA: FAD-dependent oxidoreductase [Ktedonobacterales bacterium]|nr:FAD-dependent oxidoreductase [Ktedonobacterales bacterium]
MAYRFTVNPITCINCGICMDLCPARCLDMTRPSGEGELGDATQRLSPIPTDASQRSWMMLAPVQVSVCVGCQVCAQECPTNAITIESGASTVAYAARGPISHLPAGDGWQTLDAYTRATPAEPGETPWGPTIAEAASGSPIPDHAWHVAERQAPWQSWRTWLGERKEDLRAPCQAACPVGTNAGLYVSLIAEGRYDEALRVASEPNPFPVICGRVCTAPCEAVCRRGEFDAPIAIRDLKRFAADQADPAAPPRRLSRPERQYTERVAIVGAGPTGLSAAYYLARRGYRVTVFDAMPVAGGMMVIGIPAYRLPRNELTRDIDAIRDLGVEIRLNTAIGRDVELDDLREEFDAVLLAVGAQRSQRLNIPGEQLHGVIPATTFLKAYNLTPDAPDATISGIVAVVGGGSTAMDAARSALRAGAAEVHLLYRRTRAEAPAQPEEVAAALAEGVRFHELVAPIALAGVDGKLKHILCQRMRLGAPDAQGRRAPEPIPEETFTLDVATLLVAAGEAPDPSFLPEGSRVEVAAWGGLLIDPETLATGAPGVFAAGDCSYGPKTIIEAAAHGRLAARAIHAYLRDATLHSVAELPADEFQTPSTLPQGEAIYLDLRPTPRATMLFVAPANDAHPDRRTEYALGFTEAQARGEASRCLRCDLAYLCPTLKLRTAEIATATNAPSPDVANHATNAKGEPVHVTARPD